MPDAFDIARLRHEQAFDRRVMAEQRQIADQVAALVAEAANTPTPQGKLVIPNTRRAREDLSARIWAEVLKPYFVGPGEQPFSGPKPLSPYARLLAEGVEGATRVEAERQVALLRRIVKDPVVVDYLIGPRPFVLPSEKREMHVREQVVRFGTLRVGATPAAIAATKPLPVPGGPKLPLHQTPIIRQRDQYDPYHKFVDPNGHTLSDRVWLAGQAERQALDGLLDYHIGKSTGAVEMAKALKAYLTPDAADLKTPKPYGKNGSYAARRLARTEITAAAGRGTVNASLLNPFVESVHWRLSASHKCCDICDDHAKGGLKQDGVYPKTAVPKYPAHPHELCSLLPVAGKDIDLVVQMLRADIETQRSALLAQVGGARAQALQGILNPDYLVKAIMQGNLTQAVEQAFAATKHLFTAAQEAAEIAAAQKAAAAAKKAANAAAKKAAQEAAAQAAKEAAEKAAQEAAAKKAADDKAAFDKAIAFANKKIAEEAAKKAAADAAAKAAAEAEAELLAQAAAQAAVKGAGQTSPALLGDEVVFATGKTPPGKLTLNGIDLKPAKPPDFAQIADKKIDEPPMDDKGKRRSAGIIMVEDDGRIWLVEPANHFGGYNNTFPKGGQEKGLSLQQTAIKEVFEESGLVAEIDGYLTDAEGTTSITRYYIGRRVGGAPWQGDSETWSSKLVTVDRAAEILNTKRDQDTLAKLKAHLEEQAKAKLKAQPKPTQTADKEALLAKNRERTRLWRERKKAEAEAAAGLKPTLAPVSEPEREAQGAGFPDDPEKLKVVRQLGGSTGAELVEDPATGKRYVRKRGKDAGHLLEEAAADAGYQALGVRVPAFRVYGADSKAPIKLAEFVDGETLDKVRARGGAAYKKALAQIQENYAADALMGNWDVVGAGFDNILVDKQGKVWRIDNGGSLRRRAQGAIKDSAGWGVHPDDLWTMRGKQVIYTADGKRLPPNAQTVEVFGDMKYKEIVNQMRALAPRRQALIQALPPQVRATMEKRMDAFADLVQIADTLDKDTFDYGYIDSFSKHTVGVEKEGVIAALPAKLKEGFVERLEFGRKKKFWHVDDAQGKRWDHLRTSSARKATDPPSITERVQNYVARQDGDMRVVRHWAGAQAGSSWSGEAQAFKYHFASLRGPELAKNYYWQDGLARAKRHYQETRQQYGAAKYDESLAAWHAFNYQFVRAVDFKNNDRKKGLLRLIRTESKGTMQKYGFSPGQKGVFTRGPLESTSIFGGVRITGDQVTVQNVPHHRIFGNFFMEKRPGENSGFFLGDDENEFLAMLEGVEMSYEGTLK